MTNDKEHSEYNRQGVRYMTARELREQRRRVVSRNPITIWDDEKSKKSEAIEWVARILGRTISKQR